jgi:hypothetical protein
MKKWERDSAITGRRVDISLVENFDDSLFLFPGRRVHLEISSDEELARHSSDYRKVLSGGGGADWKMIKLRSHENYRRM